MHVVGDHEKMLNINLRSNQGLPSEELVLGSPVLWQEATFDAAVRAGVGLPRPRLLWVGGREEEALGRYLLTHKIYLSLSPAVLLFPLTKKQLMVV